MENYQQQQQSVNSMFGLEPQPQQHQFSPPQQGYVQTGQSISSQPINGAEQTISQFQGGDGRREFRILPSTEQQQQPKFYPLFPTAAMTSLPSGEAGGQQGFGGYSETPTNQLQQNMQNIGPHILPHYLPATAAVSAAALQYLSQPNHFMVAPNYNFPFVPPQAQFKVMAPFVGQFLPPHQQQRVPIAKKLLQIRDPNSNELIHLLDLKKI